MRFQVKENLMNKELLVATGIIPIVIELIFLDGAFFYLETNEKMLFFSTDLFICVACNLVIGILVFIDNTKKNQSDFNLIRISHFL